MTQSLDARLAVGYLIASGGNQRLAAARASKDLGDDTITDAKLQAIISEDPQIVNILAGQVRVLAIQNILETFRVTQLAYIEKLPKLSPADTARAYKDVLTAMISLSTAQHIPQTDSQDVRVLLDKLPPKVSAAFQFFLEQPEAASALAPPDDGGVTLTPEGVLDRASAERVLAELEAA